MKKMRLYKTVITVVILSEEPYEFTNVGQAFDDYMTGDVSGMAYETETNVPIDGVEEIKEECGRIGTDPTFFFPNFEEEDSE